MSAARPRSDRRLHRSPTGRFAVPRIGAAVPPPPLSVLTLTRAAFGPRPGDIAQFEAASASPRAQLRSWLEAQLDPRGADDGDCHARLARAQLPTLRKPVPRLWTEHYLRLYRDPLTDEDIVEYYRPFFDARHATFIRLVHSRCQLLEVLVDFWHNHFNVYGLHDQAAPLFMHYDRDVIRPHALGNFRQLLEAVTKSPAMMFYLDNATNHASGPNENFARELLELHTLGAESYHGVVDPDEVPRARGRLAEGFTDVDVVEVARCFTGWRLNDGSGERGVGNDGTFLFYPPWHDTGAKRVLGVTMAPGRGQRDGGDVLDLLATHPGTALHVCRKLCRRLIADDPSDRVVRAAAETFLTSGSAPDQIARVVRVIVLSEEFAATWAAKIKRPLEAAVSALRAMNASVTGSSDTLAAFIARMGQPLFERRPPDGYPDTAMTWASTMSLLYRWVLALGIVEGWFADEGGVDTDLLGQLPADRRTGNAITDFWILRILGRPMASPADRDRLASLLAGGRRPDEQIPHEVVAGRLPGVVGLILMSPDFQWR